MSALHAKFSNQKIGGGAEAVRTKWMNMSPMENDLEKDKWVIGKGVIRCVILIRRIKIF